MRFLILLRSSERLWAKRPRIAYCVIYPWPWSHIVSGKGGNIKRAGPLTTPYVQYFPRGNKKKESLLLLKPMRDVGRLRHLQIKLHYDRQLYNYKFPILLQVLHFAELIRLLFGVLLVRLGACLCSSLPS